MPRLLLPLVLAAACQPPATPQPMVAELVGITTPNEQLLPASGPTSETGGPFGSTGPTSATAPPRLVRVDGRGHQYPASEGRRFSEQAFFDTTLQKNCGIIMISQDQAVCFPSRRMSNFFADAACTQPIAIKQESPRRCISQELTSYVAVPTKDSAEQITTMLPVMGLYQTGAEMLPSPTTVYSLSSDTSRATRCESVSVADYRFESLVPLPTTSLQILDLSWASSQDGTYRVPEFNQGAHRITQPFPRIAYDVTHQQPCSIKGETCDFDGTSVRAVSESSTCGGATSYVSFIAKTAHVVSPELEYLAATPIATVAAYATVEDMCSALGEGTKYTLGAPVTPGSLSFTLVAAGSVSRRSSFVAGLEIARDYYFKDADHEGECIEVIDDAGVNRCVFAERASEVFADADCVTPVIADEGPATDYFFEHFGSTCAPALYKKGIPRAFGAESYTINNETGRCELNPSVTQTYKLGAEIALDVSPTIP